MSFPTFKILSIQEFKLSRLCVSLKIIDTLPSTNCYLKQLAKEEAAEGTCIIANEQTLGRGRYQRPWLSPRNQGLYFSILLRPQISIENIPLISLLGGIAVASTLSTLISEISQTAKIDIKWPNDVLLNEKKVCGILTESGFAGEKLSYVVLGIGINLYQQSFPEGLLYPPTSLSLELKTESISKEMIIEELLYNLDIAYNKFEKNPQTVIENFQTLSSFALNKFVRINVQEEIIEGITQGIMSNGALVVKKQDGSLLEILAGDVVSLRI